MRKRRVVSACLSACALVLGLCLPACGGTKTVVTFWHDWSLEGAKVIAELVGEFNAGHPDTEVRTLSTGSITQKLLTSVAGKVPPDVVLLDRFMTGQFAARKALTAVNDCIERDNVDAKAFFPSIWSEATYQGKIYGIPFNTDTRALYYSRSIFAEVGLDPGRPPLTWKELGECARKTTKYDAGGKLVRVGYSPIFGNGSFSHFLWQNGGTVFDAAQRTVLFNSPEGVGAMEWLVDFVDMYGFDNLLRFQSGFASSVGNMTPLINGQVATLYEGVWNLGDLKRYAQDFYERGVGVGPAPKNVRFATLAGGFSLVIPRGAKNPEAAWEFVRFMTCNRENQMRVALRTGVIPALVEAAQDPVFVRDRLWKVFIDAMDYAEIRPVHPAFPEIDALMIAASDAAVRHNATPRDALDTAARKAQIILDKFNAHYGGQK